MYSFTPGPVISIFVLPFAFPSVEHVANIAQVFRNDASEYLSDGHAHIIAPPGSGTKIVPSLIRLGRVFASWAGGWERIRTKILVWQVEHLSL